MARSHQSWYTVNPSFTTAVQGHRILTTSPGFHLNQKLHNNSSAFVGEEYFQGIYLYICLSIMSVKNDSTLNTTIVKAHAARTPLETLRGKVRQRSSMQTANRPRCQSTLLDQQSFEKSMYVNFVSIIFRLYLNFSNSTFRRWQVVPPPRALKKTDQFLHGGTSG